MPDSPMIPRRTPVIDCFTFNDELVLLEVRLSALDSVVDRFVLVEADLTHQGIPKNLTSWRTPTGLRSGATSSLTCSFETCRRTGVLGTVRTINGEQLLVEWAMLIPWISQSCRTSMKSRIPTRLSGWCMTRHTNSLA
jgi:Glycosyltransferase family 17